MFKRHLTPILIPALFTMDKKLNKSNFSKYGNIYIIEYYSLTIKSKILSFAINNL